MKSTYLGDGVYAKFDGYYTWIYTSNGIKESDMIALEPEVLKALNRFDKECREVKTETTSLTHHQV